MVDHQDINSNRILLSLFFVLLTGTFNLVLSQELTDYSFNEMKIGVSPWARVVYAFQAGYEHKPFQTKSVTFSLEYFFAEQKGSASIGSYTSYFKINRHYVFAYVNWYPIKNSKKHFSGLMLSGSIAYSQSYYAGYLDDRGPGIGAAVAYKHIFNRGLIFSAQTQAFYYYNVNMNSYSRIKFPVVPITLSLVYRFVNSRKIKD